MVEPSVAAPGQLVNLAAARRHLDRCGAVTGREAVPVVKAGDVADLADHRDCDDGAGAEDLGERGAGGPDGDSEFLLGITHLCIDAAQFSRSSAADRPNDAGRNGR